MKIILSFLHSIFRSFARNCYWIYRSQFIKTGKKPTISFPLIVEGSGKIELRDFVTILKSVTIACGKNSKLVLNDHARIGNHVKINISQGSSFEVGRHCSILDHTSCYAHNDWQFGNNVKIATHCQVFSREQGLKGKLIIGNDTNIGDFSLIDVSENVIIGKMVAIGPRCTIYTHDHDYKEEMIPAPWKGKPIAKPVCIEDGAWIGSNVTILPGVVIGKNAVVAAGSVVTKNIPPDSLYGGVPAKVIGQKKVA